MATPVFSAPSEVQPLGDMGVGYIQPNRICSNAMLAALSRAKPAQPQLVSSATACLRLKHSVQKPGSQKLTKGFR